MTTCDRCGEKTSVTIMSMFNTQTICFTCSVAETQDPRYREACDAELRALKRRDYNFPGIGWKP